MLDVTHSLSLLPQSRGADTELARMRRLMEEAQTGKAKVQRIADRVSAVFVPIVIGLAAAAFVGWMIAGPEPRLQLHVLHPQGALLRRLGHRGHQVRHVHRLGEPGIEAGFLAGR